MCRTLAKKYKDMVDTRDAWVRTKDFYTEMERKSQAIDLRKRTGKD